MRARQLARALEDFTPLGVADRHVEAAPRRIITYSHPMMRLEQPDPRLVQMTAWARAADRWLWAALVALVAIMAIIQLARLGLG